MMLLNLFVDPSQILWAEPAPNISGQKPCCNTCILHTFCSQSFPLNYDSAIGTEGGNSQPLLKDSKLEPNVYKHYRSISNLNFLAKLAEKFVAKQLSEHLARKNLYEKY